MQFLLGIWLLILHIVSCQGDNSSACSPGYSRQYSYNPIFPVPSSCVSQSKLIIPFPYNTYGAVTWTEAEQVCSNDGGHLVSVSSAEENNRLVQCLKANQGLNVMTQDFFIGLTFSRSNWSDGSPNAYNNSCSGEAESCPSNFVNLSGKCAVIYSGASVSLPGILGCQVGG